LASAHAFTTDPVRFLLLGDSLAATAAFGLGVDAVSRYGVKVYDGGVLGCDLDPVVRINGTVSRTPPGVNCGSWRSGWKSAVSKFHAQVVGLLLGRFELADHLYDGAWRHVGQPGWDAHLVAELDLAVRILSSGGGHVVLFTFPYIDPPLEQRNGSIYPENEPSRVVAWNRLLRRVAAIHPRKVTLLDLNKVLDPGGRYRSTVDGVVVRWSDGIHITIAGGEWLRPRVLPEVAQLGLLVRGAHG
jgi:hypothetical protein